jgi:GAF domain-containing protein
MPESDAITRLPVDVDPELLLPELAQVLLSTSPVEEALTKLASVAANAVIPPASCGITVRRDGRPLTVSSSDDLATAVDELQYDRDQGPCLQSLETGDIVSVPDLATENRWDGYPAHAIAHGVGSSLSLPLSHEDHPVGALNLYAAGPRAFDGVDNVARATAVAGQVEAVLGVVLRQADLVQLTDQLKTALTSRSAIDQAIGILMAQQRCTSAEAFGLLRSASQNRNRKLRDVAADVITSTSGQAPQPHPFSDPT